MSNAGILDSILPEYKKLSEAPGLRDLEAEADRKKIPLAEILKAERARRYKAIDSYGTVFLVANPTAWESFTEVMGSYTYKGVKRPTPEIALSAKQAKDAGGSFVKREVPEKQRKDFF